MKKVSRLLAFILNPRNEYRQLHSNPDSTGASPTGVRAGNRSFFKAVNFPLFIGTLIVLVLFLVVLFGPLWAPINPYIAGQHIVPHFDSERGLWINPPLAPSAEYPLGTDEWGNDILSMLLYGTRNTLVACTFITMLRVLLGLFFGGIAGWNKGKASDQFIMGLSGVITSVPLLISTTILILALDIRRGLPVFIIALATLGWTEIAQYIRSEFIVLRKMPYIDGARAVGARGFTIAVRHILPNILPQLFVITFLELGAVLMLLGELAFIGIFIGGGSHIALGDEITGISVVTLAEVPEWGAMLAEGYRWLQAKPFIVFPPAFAFFIAVFGFTSLGEGLRRLIEIYHLSTNFLLRIRMLVFAAGITLGTIFIINNTGPTPWFEKVARAFDGQTAFQFTRDLSQMDGRGIGQPGSQEAADYIAKKFAEFGLQPGWRHSTYIFPRQVLITRPVQQPELSILDQNGIPIQSFRHQVDFGFRTTGHAGAGETEAQVVFVGFDASGAAPSWQEFRRLDLRGKVVLLIRGNAPESFTNEALIRGATGVLWIVGDSASEVKSEIELPQERGAALEKPTLPVFSISPAVANSILANDNLDISALLASANNLASNNTNWFTYEINTRVHLALKLEEPHKIVLPVVMGFRLGSDYEIANQLVVITTHYDGLGQDPDGTIFPAANHGASGVGVMLEIVRLWQQQDLDPRRSVLFIAWGGGAGDTTALKEFLAEKTSLRHLPATSATPGLDPAAIFNIDYAGAGADQLSFPQNASSRLIQLIETTASEAGVEIADSQTPYPGQGPLLKAYRADVLHLAWAGNQIPPQLDTIDRVSPQKLEQLGQVLSLGLTKIVRESRY